MAVVPRKRKNRTVYGVLTSWAGGDHWELVGPNRREAELLDKQRKREVKAGTFRPGELTDVASVKAFADRWLELRDNRSAENERALVKRHVLSVEWFASLKMGEVRPRHIIKLIDEMSRGTLSAKSVSNVMGIIRVMFRDAVIQDVLTTSPYIVPHGTLKRSGVKRKPYDADEVLALIGPAVGEKERIWNTLAFYTGARCGEICGLRWSDWDEKPVPLGALTIERQYEGQALKTERPRVTPVHPELADALAAWRERWSFHFLHRPGPNDLIVPRLMPGCDPEPMTKNAAYKAWVRACSAAKVTNRSIHSSRHTFITFARRGGADPKIVELVTHNPKGTIIDRYTTRDWAELCSAVLAVCYAPNDGPVDGSSLNHSNSGSRAWTRTSESSETPREAGAIGETGGFETPGIHQLAPCADARLDACPTDDDPEAFEWASTLAEHAERARVAEVLWGANAPGEVLA